MRLDASFCGASALSSQNSQVEMEISPFEHMISSPSMP